MSRPLKGGYFTDSHKEDLLCAVNSYGNYQGSAGRGTEGALHWLDMHFLQRLRSAR